MTRRVRAGRRDAADSRYDATRYDVTENSARAALFKGKRTEGVAKRQRAAARQL